jgi:predicted nucleic acid-binding protein
VPEILPANVFAAAVSVSVLEPKATFPEPARLFNEDAADYYGKIRADLEKRGQVIGAMDMLIAAHALSLDIILVTNNSKEFLRIPHLTIENWLE